MSGNGQIQRGLCVICAISAVVLATSSRAAAARPRKHRTPATVPANEPATGIVAGGAAAAGTDGAGVAGSGGAVVASGADEVKGAVTIDVSAAEVAAVRALGADVRFFTSRARPIGRLSEIRNPGVEVGSADLELARGVLALLRAGGVRFSGGAFDVLSLVGDNHLSSLFGRGKPLSLFVVRARPDGAERAIAARGGGVPLLFRAPGPEAAAAGSTGDGGGAASPVASRPRQAAVAGEVRTSFGPLRRVQRSSVARARSFDRVAAKVAERRARRGYTFVVVHIERDFAAGAGKVGYLFGSGILLDPDFNQLVLLDGSRRHTPAAVFDEGPKLELAYEVPSRARNLRLEDGDKRFPLAETVAAAAP